MEWLNNPYLVIIIVNSAVGLFVYGVQRFIPELKRKNVSGLYIILIPIGFGLANWDISPRFMSIMVLIGVGLFLFGIKAAIEKVSKDCKASG